jgi:methylenetetrahydrofolate dehydrogenase (NADP+)/methenyltetrahydrofolate cyclohydrolase
MDGRALAERIRADVAAEVAKLGSLGLATLLVGDDPASAIYIRLKHQAADEAGIASKDIRLPEDTSEEELLERVAELNIDDAVDGILVQLPLPAHIDEARVLRGIDPMKDVDGIHPLNAGQLYLGRPTLVPATPIGIVALLDEYGVPLEGAKAVIVGRSDIVGKNRCRARRRRRSPCDGRRRVHDSRSGRRRADDDRLPASECGARRALSPWRACVSGSLSYTRPVGNHRSAARCPGRRLFVRRSFA